MAATRASLPSVGGWLRRWAALVLVLAVLGAVAGAAYAWMSSERFTSSARVLIRPSVGNPLDPDAGSSSQQVTSAVATEAALVDSAAVLALANESTGNDLDDDDVSVTVPPNTSTLVMTASGASPTEAEVNAQALAEAFLEYRAEVSEETKEKSSEQLRSQISTIRDALSRLKKGSGADARRADVLTAQLVSLQASLVETQVATTDPGTTLSGASEGRRSGVGGVVLAAAGALGGLLVGLLLALALARRDTRIDHAATSVAGVPVLSALGTPRRHPDLRAAAEADKQAFQRLRTYVLASSALPSAVAVSGVSGADRSGEVAAGLGKSMVRAGYDVVVVVANPGEASAFGEEVASSAGLAEALRGGANAQDLVFQREGLAVLSPGTGIAGEQELLSGRGFRQVVQELKAAYDYVLIVTGPANHPAELATARNADVLLLAARGGGTRAPEVRDVANRAHLVGLRVTGLVLQPLRPLGSEQAPPDADVATREGEPEASDRSRAGGSSSEGGGKAGASRPGARSGKAQTTRPAAGPEAGRDARGFVRWR